MTTHDNNNDTNAFTGETNLLPLTDVQVYVGDGVKIGDQEVTAGQEVTLRHVCHGLLAVDLTIFTNELLIDWTKLPLAAKIRVGSPDGSAVFKGARQIYSNDNPYTRIDAENDGGKFSRIFREDTPSAFVIGVMGKAPAEPAPESSDETDEKLSITDRAAKVIARCWPNGRGVRKDDSAELARALDDAGLLTPDLPEPGSGGIWADTRGAWVVSPLKGGTCVHVDDDLTPDETRDLADALYAAADHAEEVGTNG